MWPVTCHLKRCHYWGQTWKYILSSSRQSVILLGLKTVFKPNLCFYTIMKQKPIVIVDNGGSALKLGVAGKNEVNARYVTLDNCINPFQSLWINRACRIVPNAVVRSKGDRTTYFGNEIERCRDFSSLHYRLPFEKVWSFLTASFC